MADPQLPEELPAPDLQTTDDGRAYVRLASGELASVPQDQLGMFLDEGRGTLATADDVAARQRQKQYGEGLGNELAAFGEGALSGATLGLSDVAARALSDDYADGLAARREFSPTAAGVGEAAGIIGATLATGGTAGAAQAGGRGLLAGAARVATAPTRALVGLGEAATSGAARVLGAQAATGVIGQAVRQGAAYAVGGAVEGALFGAAKVATDDFLTDHEITAERIAAGAELGAIWGGAIGGAMGATGSLLGAAGRKVADLWNRTDAEREASRVLDDALTASGTVDNAVDSAAGAATGAQAEASVTAQKLTADQKIVQELGYRSDDELVAELQLAPTSAEQQSILEQIKKMGPEEAASRDFKRLQQDYTTSFRERLNEIAEIQDRANTYLNRGKKLQTVKDQLEVEAPEWTEDQVTSLLSDVRATRDRFQKMRSDSNLFNESQHSALQDVIDGADEVEKLLAGAKPLPIEKAPRDAIAYKVDQAKVRTQLQRLNGEGDGATQYVLRYLPIDDIDTAGRQLRTGPLRELDPNRATPPIQARPLDNGLFALDDGASRVAAAREAGLTHVPAIVPEVPQVGALLRGDREAVAEAFMALDDFKGYLGRAARKVGRNSPQVNRAEAAIQREYMGYRASLENESIWGKPVATMQRMTNAVESEAIRTGRVFEQRFAQAENLQNIRGGEFGFDTLSTADSGKVGGFLNSLGRAENFEAERDFVLGLTRNVELMKTKGDFYRVPPELRAEFDRAVQIAESVKSDLRTLKGTKEMADRYADQVESLRNVPVVGETAAKLKITGSKAVQFASNLLSDTAVEASGGAVSARAGAAAGAGASGRSAGTAAIKAGIKGERAVENAAKGVVKWLRDAGKSTGRAVAKTGKAVYDATKTGPLLGVNLALDKPQTYERLVRNVGALRDPQSDERRVIRANVYELRQQNPMLADAIEQHTQRVADFLGAKAGELSVTPKPGDPFGAARKPRHDPAKMAKFARYVAAATNPAGAMERIAGGELVREDIEVLQTLYPRMYQRVVQEVLLNLSDVDKLPSYEARLRLSHLLNAPADPSMSPERVQALQAVANSGAGVAAQQQANGPSDDGGVLSPSQRREPRLASVYQTQSQRIEDRRRANQ